MILWWFSNAQSQSENIIKLGNDVMHLEGAFWCKYEMMGHYLVFKLIKYVMRSYW